MIRLQQVAELVVNHRIQRILGYALQLRGDADLRVRVGCRTPALTLIAYPANRQSLQPARGNQLRQMLLRQMQGTGAQDSSVTVNCVARSRRAARR